MDSRILVARLTVGAILSMIVGVLLAVVSIRSAVRSWRGGVS